MKKKLLLIGASGHGKVVAEIATKIGRWHEIVFIDDDINLKSALGISVIGNTKELGRYIDEYEIFTAIGDNNTRTGIHSQAKTTGAEIPVLIHPEAVVGKEVTLGAGTVVMAGAVINCCTKIGEACIINTGATVDHDSVIEDFVHVSPGAHLGGTVTIGKGTWIGIGGIVSNNLNICGNCIIGAGAVVTKDITEPGTYIGIPAKRKQ